MKLVKILPDKIQVRTDDAEFKNARLNDLISVSDGEVELVTMITAITDNDVETQMDENAIMEELQQPSLKVVECSILGSLVDGSFKQQIDRYPSTDVRIETVCDSYFGSMLVDSKTKAGFKIGNYSSYDFPAYIDGNKLYQRHSCIVGNTGSGKSETLAKILEETSCLPGANIILFDIHGEYSRLSYADNIKIGPGFPFPIWMLGFSDMVANVLKVKEDSTVVMSALRYCFQSHVGDMKVNESKPIYFSFPILMEYMEGLNNEEVQTGEFYKTGDKAGKAKTVRGEWNGKLGGVINMMKTMYADKRYAFLFEDKPQSYLADFLNRLMGGDKPVKNINLSDIPHDAAIPIIGAITKLVFDIQRTTGPDFRPITLVCDEAHVYIPNNFQLSASERRMVETFEDIAKEGRKFGITLLVASQRPSELNKTIMAQCANFIVGKLNNETDKAMIKGMLPDGNESLIDSTTMFSPGDVLVAGDAAPIPLKIHVELAKERPQSRTIDFWDKWGRAERIPDYSERVKEYLED